MSKKMSVPMKREMLEELIKYLDEDIIAYQSVINQMVKNRIVLRKQGEHAQAITKLRELEIQFNAVDSKCNLARNLISFARRWHEVEVEIEAELKAEAEAEAEKPT